MTNIQRQELLSQLEDMVETDHPGCEGQSVFCPGCVSVRAVQALCEVYNDVDQSGAATLPTYSLSGVPPLIPTDPQPLPPSTISIGELDDIAERIIKERDSGEPDDEHITLN